MSGFSLADAPQRRPLVIVETSAARHVARRLASLGLRRGAQIEIVQRTAGGGRLVAVSGARVALGEDLLDDFRVTSDD